MQNIFEIVRDGLHFNKFKLGNIICVEYTCPLEDEWMGVASQTDYIVHVLSGKKTWKSIENQWVMEAGQTLYVKKGVTLVNQFFDEEFCMLAFFIDDEFIKESMIELNRGKNNKHDDEFHHFTATDIESNDHLMGFFHSMLSYFKGKAKPDESILRLKLKELLANLILGNENSSLRSYFYSVLDNSKPYLPHIMELNFCYNLSLEEYAKLCHRSLSSFKRDFNEYFQTTPGKWLLIKRLNYAATLIENKISNISQIAFSSGFEDVSHFSRVFKEHFGKSPTEYRKSYA